MEEDRTSILFVDSSPSDTLLSSLRTSFEITAVVSEAQALRALRVFQPTLVITELALSEGDGVSVCRQAKETRDGLTSVLVTTADLERVPDALRAGCDGVLLKPFAPNLLHGRIGRLLRQKNAAGRQRAAWRQLDRRRARDDGHAIRVGTTVVVQAQRCPACGLGEAVSFDMVNARQEWLACLSCRNVWIATTRRLLASRRSLSSPVASTL